MKKLENIQYTSFTSNHLKTADVPKHFTADELAFLLPVAQDKTHPENPRVVEEIFFRNWRIIETAVSAYLNRSVTSDESLEEAYQTACEGLLKAIYKCDIHRPEGFYKLARLEIHHALSKAKRTTETPFNISLHSWQQVKRVNMANRVLEAEGNETPSWKEISEKVYDIDCANLLEKIRSDNPSWTVGEVHAEFNRLQTVKPLKRIPPEKIGMLASSVATATTIENDFSATANRLEENPEAVRDRKDFVIALLPLLETLEEEEANILAAYLEGEPPSTTAEKKLLKQTVGKISAPERRHLLPETVRVLL